MAESAARLSDPLTTVQTLDHLQEHARTLAGHTSEIAAALRTLFLPKIRIPATPVSASILRLGVQAIPGYTYVIESSVDLRGWTAVATNTPVQSTFEVTLERTENAAHRYYRMVWKP